MAGRPSTPGARDDAAGPARCPECGSGDLFTIEVARPAGEAWRGEYCAGQYDRDRRRFLRRSCGYAGTAPAAAADPVVSAESEAPVALSA